LLIYGNERSRKRRLHPRKEGFDRRVLLGSGGAQSRELVEQQSTQVWRGAARSLKPRHPNPIAQQQMIQQSMDTAERALALLAILGVV
jgi:hypothetical protein